MSTSGTATPAFTTSRDGTRIGYLTQGSGPGVVLVQGAMGDVHAFAELAHHLEADFTVVSAERRGRGLSPRPYAPTHDIARDVEDIDAVMAATGASYVFGLSSGAVIALSSARTLGRITKAAVYEPPLPKAGLSRRDVTRLHAHIEAGDLPSALVEALVASGTAPPVIRRLPRPVSRALARAVLWVDARGGGPRARLRDLLPGIRYDFHVVARANDDVHEIAAVTKPVLLLGGTKSPAFLRESLESLQQLIPHARRVELRGLGHSGPWNRSRGGRPHVVAKELRAFFSAGRTALPGADERT